MKIPRSAITSVVIMLLETDARQVTKHLSEKLVVRASRRWKPSRRATRTEIVLTIGAPNYREREFIRSCKKAGEPFPVKKPQLKFYEKRRP